jgi:hypothetical protein
VSAAEGTQGRIQKRVAVGLEMHVSGKDANGLPFDDMVHSGNVSRTGASFYTRRELQADMVVDVLIPRRPGDPKDADFSSRARIVRVQPGSAEGERIIAIHFLDRNFHRVYVSEETS